MNYRIYMYISLVVCFIYIYVRLCSIHEIQLNCTMHSCTWSNVKMHEIHKYADMISCIVHIKHSMYMYIFIPVDLIAHVHSLYCIYMYTVLYAKFNLCTYNVQYMYIYIYHERIKYSSW